jgi:hypothetical protein
LHALGAQALAATGDASAARAADARATEARSVLRAGMTPGQRAAFDRAEPAARTP